MILEWGCLDNEKIIDMLIKHGANVNESKNEKLKSPILHSAVIQGELSIIIIYDC